MVYCAACSATVPEGNTTCPACGSRVDGTASTWVEGPTPGGRSRGPAGEHRRPRFASGTVLSGRYRVATLLGRGGMGEVYRCDDLKLDQPVALKFLPAPLTADPAARQRLLRRTSGSPSSPARGGTSRRGPRPTWRPSSAPRGAPPRRATSMRWGSC